MVKSESKTRQVDPPPHIDCQNHNVDRKLDIKIEPDAGETLTIRNFELVKSLVTYKPPTPEEIETAFLKCYSKFIGTELNKETTWKSDTFNRSHKS
jgi:hypothetical protein